MKEYQQKVKNSQDLMILAKKEKKRLKTEKTYKLLNECKNHGGPVSPEGFDLLDSLSEKELILEVRYLRATIAPNIRERFKLPTGKFQKLTESELKVQIKNVLRPTIGNMEDLDNLFMNIEGYIITLCFFTFFPNFFFLSK